jgi:hypothetical protein
MHIGNKAGQTSDILNKDTGLKYFSKIIQEGDSNVCHRDQFPNSDFT